MAQGAAMEGDRRRKAEQILPPEVWDMILKYVDDDDDCWRCYQTCTQFQQLLKPRIFAQAFTVALTHLTRKAAHLTEKEVLTCRSVSPKWRRTVDDFLQSRPSRSDLSCYRAKTVGFQQSFTDQADSSPNRMGAVLLNLYKKEDAKLLSDWITVNWKLRANENVFCGRHLIIVDTLGRRNQNQEAMEEEKREFHKIVSDFLEKCGSHFWYVSICSLVLDHLPQWFFNTFWTWMKLLPNVKMLTCQITLDYMQGITSPFMMVELQEGLALHPFPTLPHLETLQLNGTPDIILHSALQSNKHVKNVEVNPFPYRPGLPLNLRQWTGTHLKEFCITICHITELDHLIDIGWPLEKLTLSFALGTYPVPSFENRVERLERFGETLRYLRIKLPRISLGSYTSPWQLRLPRLETLYLHVIDHAALDFIVPMNSLRFLKMSVMYWEDVGGPQIILGGRICPMNRLLAANIWELLPTLRMIEVDINFRARQAATETPRPTRTQKFVYHRNDKRFSQKRPLEHQPAVAGKYTWNFSNI